MSSKSTRYFIFSKRALRRTGVYKALSNASTREDARRLKRIASYPAGIFDRLNGQEIR